MVGLFDFVKVKKVDGKKRIYGAGSHLCPPKEIEGAVGRVINVSRDEGTVFVLFPRSTLTVKEYNVMESLEGRGERWAWPFRYTELEVIPGET